MRTLRRILSVLLVATLVLTATAYGAPGDVDDDGVLDSQDNCVEVPNPDQADRNLNGVGDACDDPDADKLDDRYELYNTYGPGPNFRRTNPDNFDTDGDSLRDGREVEQVYADGKRTDPTLADTDADGYEDGTELAIGTSPTNPDSDGDGVKDGKDNCARVYNPDQKNTYGNSRGDACEPPPPPPPCTGVNPCQIEPALATVQDTAEAVIGQLPGVDVRTVSDLARMASDGYVLQIFQNAPDWYLVYVVNATTGALVDMNLQESKLYSVNGPVAVFAYDADDKPGEGSRINVKWLYNKKTKRLSIKVLPKQSHTGAVTFAVPPVGYPVGDCTPTTAVVESTCDGNALAFYNPGKTLRAVDALDAVPFATTTQR